MHGMSPRSGKMGEDHWVHPQRAVELLRNSCGVILPILLITSLPRFMRPPMGARSPNAVSHRTSIVFFVICCFTHFGRQPLYHTPRNTIDETPAADRARCTHRVTHLYFCIALDYPNHIPSYRTTPPVPPSPPTLSYLHRPTRPARAVPRLHPYPRPKGPWKVSTNRSRRTPSLLRFLGPKMTGVPIVSPDTSTGVEFLQERRDAHAAHFI
ncbi:hypothetical protein HD554DRAFT_1842561 [Boletus coccyginus]|nr:hypothetical protein HD554DRAFT_1842561 [Boletus coccyginus]